MNLAVGGAGEYFPDGQGGKPWSNADPHAPNAFINAKGQWYPTWKGDDAALQIDSVKVWSLNQAQPTEAHFFWWASFTKTFILSMTYVLNQTLIKQG